jgi:YfiH family protein
VSENRRRLSAWLGTENILLPHQVHGTRVAFVAGGENLEGYDALVTQQARLCICVSTADCIPILLYDAETKSVAAVHAGWRGTAARIVEKVIAEMTARLGTRPSALRAVIGPGISLEAFEVGDEVYEQFSNNGFDMEQIALRFPDTKNPAQQKWHIDLPLCNRLQLCCAGLSEQNIFTADICTYRNPAFFSARREGIATGRNMTCLTLLQ